MSNPPLTRVLIVDDEPFIRRTVKSIVRAIGNFVLEEADDGESALAKMASFRPDLVICDVGMKPMDGLEFLERLRRHHDETLRHTRVIMLTADATQEAVAIAQRTGPDGYLVKPVSPKILADQLRTMFELPIP